MEVTTSILYERRLLSLLRKGSRSRRLWESPPILSERYERRPCLCHFRCTCRSRIFLLFVKNGFVVGMRSLKVTAHHSNNAGSSYEYHHCVRVSATCRLALDKRPTQCNSPHTHTWCTLSCSAEGRQGGREAGKKRGREGGTEGGRDTSWEVP